MYALFSAGDLLAQNNGQFALDELLISAEAPASTVVEPVVGSPVMPASWELIPREAITGQGVLGA
jgi:hypothetical protein